MRQLRIPLFCLVLMIGKPIAQTTRHPTPPVARQNESQPTQKSAKTIYAENREAVVLVKGEQKEGSGFVLTSDGKIVTNYHVVAGERSVTVKFSNGLELSTEDVIAYDSRADLAIIQLGGKGFKVLSLGDSDLASPGDQLVIISNPLGLESTVTSGLLSGVREQDGQRLLQISVPVSPGSSGGPVFNNQGKVVGIVLATVRGGQNINLAIPSNEVTRLLGTQKAAKLAELTSERSQEAQPAPLDTHKIKRYLDAAMYDEAQSELMRAVQIDPFNAQTHLLLGDVLVQQRHYEDALKQFQISLRLEPQMWQAREGLADAHYMLWESGKELSNRIRAAQSYEEHVSFKLREPASDIEAAKTRAKAKLAQLDSPYGKWQTDYGVMYQLRLITGGWSFDPVGETKYPVHAFGKTSSGNTLSGQRVEQTGECTFFMTVEIVVLEHGTKLEVDMSVFRAGAVASDQRKFCEKLGKMAPTREMRLKRVD